MCKDMDWKARRREREGGGEVSAIISRIRDCQLHCVRMWMEMDAQCGHIRSAEAIRGIRGGILRRRTLSYLHILSTLVARDSFEQSECLRKPTSRAKPAKIPPT